MRWCVPGVNALGVWFGCGGVPNGTWAPMQCRSIIRPMLHKLSLRSKIILSGVLVFALAGLAMLGAA